MTSGYDIVIEKKTKAEFEVKATKTGENPQKCPVCSDQRKPGNQNKPCFSYNAQTGLGHCQNCDASFYRKNENHKSYVRPVWENKTDLPESIVDFFMKRNIGQDVLREMKITNTDRGSICFNYFREGQLINTKYRTLDKRFAMHTGAELILYNLDGISGQKEIFITEGECDALVMIQAGFKNTCSVPAGANPKNNNLQYMDSCWEAFKDAERVYIMTDTDLPGNQLADELARRIGSERCFRVKSEYKDVNDALNAGVKINKEWVDKNSTFYPLVGVYQADSFWTDLIGIRKHGFPKGWRPRGEFGKKVAIHPGYQTVITGVPGHGKSEHLDQVLLELGIDYNLRGAYFSPENFPTQIHIIKIIEKLTGMNFWELSEFQINEIKEWIDDHIFWVYPDDGFGLTNILEHVRKAITRYGINWYVIDPWNKIDHQFSGSETAYISKCLDEMDNFNKKNNVHGFLVAHPTKMQKNEDGSYVVPNLYSISGSAHFFNKAALGWTVYKTGQGTTDVHIQKVKFKYWGEVGVLNYIWDHINGRYYTVNPDRKNWLIKESNLTPISQLPYKDDLDSVPF
jgi:twinkle protein